jgi:hypothetical protein
MKKLANSLKLISLLSVILALSSCHKDQEPNKIIDGVPLNTTEIVIPGQAGQQFYALVRDLSTFLVPILNRLQQTGLSFSELSGPDGQMRYTFTTTERHYNSANYSIQFRDSNNTAIDPIQNQNSTTTVKSIDITGTGSSSQFNFTIAATLTIETVGDLNSKKRITGSSSFNGSSYSMTFTIDSPGLTGTESGLTEGTFSSSGTGPNSQPTTLQLICSFEHTADGSISWEDRSGGFHIEPDASAFIVTNQERLFLP